LILMRKRLGGIEGTHILRGLGQVALAATGMGIALVWWGQAQITSTPWLVALGGIAIGGLVYFVGVWVLQVPEMRDILSFVQRRIKK